MRLVTRQVDLVERVHGQVVADALVVVLVAAPAHADGVPPGGACRIELGHEIGEKHRVLGRHADHRSDRLVGRRLLLRTSVLGVEVAGDQRQQVTLRGGAEPGPLGAHRPGREDVQAAALAVPAAHGRDGVVEEVRHEVTGGEALGPDPALERLQRGDLLVPVEPVLEPPHHALDRRVRLAGQLAHCCHLRSHCVLFLVGRDPGGEARAAVGVQRVVDERCGRSGALDVEDHGAQRHTLRRPAVVMVSP